jgi:LL-diaminopimelate aminotransferase
VPGRFSGPQAQRAPKAAVTKAAKRVEFESAEAVSQWLITDRLISTVPWDDAGAYLRFSVTFAASDGADEARLLAELSRRLAEVRFEFA